MQEELRITDGAAVEFKLPLPETDELRNIVEKISSVSILSPAQGKKELCSLLKGFFPLRYRDALENISDSDAFKLFAALAKLICAPAEGNDPPPPSAEPPEDSYSPSDDDEIIDLAYLYKWSLEYASSLSPAVRRRCLAVARPSQRAGTVPCRPTERFSLEDLSGAIARNRQALKRFRE